MNRDYLLLDKRKFTVGSAYTVTYKKTEFPAILAKVGAKSLTFGVCTKSGILQIVLTLDSMLDNHIEFEEIYEGKPADEEELKALCNNKSYEMNDYSVKIDDDEDMKVSKTGNDDDYYDDIDPNIDDIN